MAQKLAQEHDRQTDADDECGAHLGVEATLADNHWIKIMVGGMSSVQAGVFI